MARTYVITDEARRIRLIRKENKLTQKDLGELLSKTQGTIQKYESGELFIPTEVYKVIHEKFKYTYEYLINGKAPKKTTPKEESLIKNVNELTQKIDLLNEKFNELNKKMNKIYRDYYGDKKATKSK